MAHGDDELIARHRAGDAGAFDELVSRHYQQVLVLAMRMGLGHDEAHNFHYLNGVLPCENECYLHESKHLASWPANTPPRSFWGKGVHSFENDGPASDAHVVMVMVMDEFGTTLMTAYAHYWRRSRLIPFLNMVPELGRFLKDHLGEEVTAYCEKVAGGIPDWYVTYADCVLAGEQYYLYPEDPHQVFMARAWVASDEAERLWKYADLPYVATGDWYHTHKLAETIKAYRGWRWE